MGGFSFSVSSNSIKNLVVAAFALTALSACGGKGASATGQGDVGRADDRPTCELGFFEGKAAKLDLLKQNTTEVTNFGKKFYGNVLNAVADASAAETVKVLKTMGVAMYRAKGEYCQIYTQLPFASDGDVAKDWEEANQDMPPGQFVLGLYLAREKGSSMDPAIIVRDDSSRWTLIHEAMHFLFHKWNLTEGTSNIRAGNEAAKLTQDTKVALSNYKAAATGENFKRLVTAFDALIRSEHEQIKRGPLEESSVEDTLAERYVKGLLSFVPKTDAYNNWYLMQNLDRAAPYYAQRGKSVEGIRAEGTARSAELQAQIEAVEKQLGELNPEDPNTPVLKDQLREKRKLLVENKAGFDEGMTATSDTQSFIEGVALEIHELALKSESRKTNAPNGDPFAVMADLALRSLSTFNRQPEMANHSIKGCRAADMPAYENLEL